MRFGHILPRPYYERFFELDHAVTELGAQIYTHVHGAAMDAAEFEPFHARVAELGALLQVTRAAAPPGRTTRSGSECLRAPEVLM